MLGARRGEGLRTISDWLASPFVLLGVPPNALTVFGLLFAFVPAGFFWMRDYLWGGIALLLAAGFDVVDGAVARATNRASAFGGYLDSVLDRAADAVFLLAIGLGVNDRTWWVVIGAGLIGQFVTSYARARAYQDAEPPPETWNQFFERPERILLLSLACLLQGLFERIRPETEVLFWGLVAFALLANWTGLRRVLKTREILDQTRK